MSNHDDDDDQWTVVSKKKRSDKPKKVHQQSSNQGNRNQLTDSFEMNADLEGQFNINATGLRSGVKTSKTGNSLKRDYCHELSRSIDPVVVVQTPKFVPVHEEKILQADERKRVPKLSDPDAVKVVMDDDSVDVKAQNVFQSMLPKTVKVLHEQPTDGANLQEGDQFIVVERRSARSRDHRPFRDHRTEWHGKKGSHEVHQARLQPHKQIEHMSKGHAEF